MNPGHEQLTTNNEQPTTAARAPVSIPQLLFTVALIVVLLGLGGYYAWRQVKTLRGAAGADNLPPEDRRYLRYQAWRRLASCALMVVFAGLLAGTFFLEDRAQQLAERTEAARQRGDEQPLPAEEKPFVRFYAGYWIAALLVLLGIVSLALYDVIAIRRFGRRQFRKLQDDRRAMIARQVARLRGERNGHD
jgi:uncharacterized membrane protein YbhN (UPF0104 family)